MLSKVFKKQLPPSKQASKQARKKHFYVSTIIICIVLYWFGDRFTTSVIQGFALTLGIGVLISMFTAFTVSRLLMRLISSTPIGNKDNLYDPLGSRKVGSND